MSSKTLDGLLAFSLLSVGTKVINWFVALSDDFFIPFETFERDAFLVNASVKAIVQSAADKERRVGNSNPSCTVLQSQNVTRLTKVLRSNTK